MKNIKIIGIYSGSESYSWEHAYCWRHCLEIVKNLPAQ